LINEIIIKNKVVNEACEQLAIHDDDEEEEDIRKEN